MRVATQHVPGGQADRGEDEDGDDHHHEQERGPAARVQAREALGVRGLERPARLEAGDDLVLGAVVLEHAAQVALAGHQRPGSRGRSRCGRALDEPEQQAEPSWSLIRLAA